jgi:hypothetical protein
MRNISQGAYINPLSIDRGPDGEVSLVLINNNNNYYYQQQLNAILSGQANSLKSKKNAKY